MTEMSWLPAIRTPDMKIGEHRTSPDKEPRSQLIMLLALMALLSALLITLLINAILGTAKY